MRSMSAVASSSYKLWLAIVISAVLLACASHHHVSTPTDHVSAQRAGCTDVHTGDNCASDTDCPTGTACICDYVQGGAGGPGAQNLCQLSNCRTDADCGPGGFCSPSIYARCARINGYFCHAPNDECGVNADCTPPQICAFGSEVGHWVCTDVPPCGGG